MSLLSSDADPSATARRDDPAAQPHGAHSSTEILDALWADPPGLYGQLAGIQNDAVGGRLMLAAFAFFIAAGVLALLIRMQLFLPESRFLGPETYSQVFTMHGSTMMYLFVIPMIEGLAILLLPSMMGNREMPFPRLGAFSLWTFIFGGLLFFASFFLGEAPQNGWYAYPPLSGEEFSPGLGMEFWLLALSVAEVGAIAAGVEIITAVFRMRAPGMSLGRMPVYMWAMAITAFMILFAFTPLIVVSLLLELDRKVGTQFFNSNAGGTPLLWQHLFWIFGHPEVYIQFIPAAGIASMIIPVFARKRFTGYSYVTMSLLATGFLSFGLWVHHMFTTGLPQVGQTFFAAASILIGIPAGIQVFAWIATIWGGKPRWQTPFLFMLGFIFLFVLGGVTGIMVGSIPFDRQVHDSYFVVAHFHYVLIGGVTFPIFGAFYYWFPKVFGRLMSERMGQWNFWTMFVGFNLTFFPMHISGLLGMPRRYWTYPGDVGWTIWNQLASIGSILFAVGVLLFMINFAYSIKRGRKASANPWGADTLEFSIDSPLPNYSFARFPIVRSRSPLWDQDDLYSSEDKRTEKIANALAEWPLKWRATLVTSLIDARPEEIFRVSTPSAWPFVAAIGMATIFGGEIFELRMISLGGIALVFGAITAWNWPTPAPITDAEAEAFEEIYDIAVRPQGSPIVARWAMGLTILILGIAMGCFLFAYYYIRIVNPVWPLEGIPLPALGIPALITVFWLGGAAAHHWGINAIKRDNRAQLRLGMGLGWLLGATGLGLQLLYFRQLSFDWSTNAYGSVFFGLGGFVVLVMSAGLIMSALVQFWTWRRHYSRRDHVGIENTTIFWWAVWGGWLIVAGTIYLFPHLTA